jgi:hypothetical protein
LIRERHIAFRAEVFGCEKIRPRRK